MKVFFILFGFLFSMYTNVHAAAQANGETHWPWDDTRCMIVYDAHDEMFTPLQAVGSFYAIEPAGTNNLGTTLFRNGTECSNELIDKWIIDYNIQSKIYVTGDVELLGYIQPPGRPLAWYFKTYYQVYQP